MKIPSVPALGELRARLNDVTDEIPESVRKTVVAVTAVVGGTIVAYYIYPTGFIRLRTKWARYRSGVRMRSVTGDDGSRTSYGEWGDRDKSPVTLIMIHGFGGGVDNWVPVVPHLPHQLHCVAVEMPGYGNSTFQNEADVSMGGMARRLKQLIDDERCGLRNRRLHVIGAAMGGTVAGLFTAEYPSYVALLTLICPAMRTDTDSDMIARMRAGGSLPLMPTCVQDMRDGMELLLHRPPRLSNTILRGLIGMRKPYMQVMELVMKSMRSEIWEGDEDLLIGKKAEKINSPTQLIWGQHDKIIDISGADYLKKKLPKLVSYDQLDTGHAIFLEKPEELASKISEFHQKLNIHVL